MANLSIGIVGLPNAGKSTLFQALTTVAVPAESYPFCTIEPNVGIVPVPDGRLDRIAELVIAPKVTPAVVEFVDIAGCSTFGKSMPSHTSSGSSRIRPWPA